MRSYRSVRTRTRSGTRKAASPTNHAEPIRLQGGFHLIAMP